MLTLQKRTIACISCKTSLSARKMSTFQNLMHFAHVQFLFSLKRLVLVGIKDWKVIQMSWEPIYRICQKTSTRWLSSNALTECVRTSYVCRTSLKIRILISACNESASRSHFWCRRSGSRGTWALPTQSSEACQFKSFCSRGGNPFATTSSSREAKKKVNT